MVATKTEKIIDIGKGKRAMRLISVDAGNFEIKACSGKEPIAIRSIFKKLPSSANLPRCTMSRQWLNYPTAISICSSLLIPSLMYLIAVSASSISRAIAI
jgi:hypothetical protein